MLVIRSPPLGRIYCFHVIQSISTTMWIFGRMVLRFSCLLADKKWNFTPYVLRFSVHVSGANRCDYGFLDIAFSHSLNAWFLSYFLFTLLFGPFNCYLYLRNFRISSNDKIFLSCLTSYYPFVVCDRLKHEFQIETRFSIITGSGNSEVCTYDKESFLKFGIDRSSTHAQIPTLPIKLNM